MNKDQIISKPMLAIDENIRFVHKSVGEMSDEQAKRIARRLFEMWRAERECHALEEKN